MFEYFTQEAIKVISIAQSEARRLGHNFVGTEQILLGVIGEETSNAAKILTERGIDLKNARIEVEKIIGRGSGYVASEIPFTPKVKRILEQAFTEARQLEYTYIAPEHLLIALVKDGEGVAARVLKNLGINPAEVGIALQQSLSAKATISVGSKQGRSPRKTPTLDEFGTNLTQLAKDGKLDPVVGRQKEIERAIQILARRTKNNPVLIGEPGVGKTAIASGLAQRIADGDIPSILEDKQVISLDIGLLVAGTRLRGDFEERLKGIVEEVRANGNIILVIDELHTLIGTGSVQGGMDAANMLKPALARGELQCMGMTTLDEYRQHIEKDAALERRFQPIMVGEPSVEETIEILYGLRQAYEQHHKVKISDEAVVAAAKLADRYISDRYMPDKAIDLIDEAGSRVHLSHTAAKKKGMETVDIRCTCTRNVRFGCQRGPCNAQAADLSAADMAVALELLLVEERRHRRELHAWQRHISAAAESAVSSAESSVGIEGLHEAALASAQAVVAAVTGFTAQVVLLVALYQSCLECPPS